MWKKLLQLILTLHERCINTTMHKTPFAHRLPLQSNTPGLQMQCDGVYTSVTQILALI